MKKEISEKLKDKTVLITGGTGSLGQALTRKLLETDVKTIRTVSYTHLTLPTSDLV